MNFYRVLNRLSPRSLLVIIIIWYVFPFVFIGKYSVISWHDNFEVSLNHLISLGNVGNNQSAWTTLSTSGTNISTLGFTGIINRSIYSFIPGWLAYQILVVIEISGAIIGSYFLCKKIFSNGKYYNLLPGVLFGVSYIG